MMTIKDEVTGQLAAGPAILFFSADPPGEGATALAQASFLILDPRHATASDRNLLTPDVALITLPKKSRQRTEQLNCAGGTGRKPHRYLASERQLPRCGTTPFARSRACGIDQPEKSEQATDRGGTTKVVRQGITHVQVYPGCQRKVAVKGPIAPAR
jgi:hypothetical protein